MNGRKGPAAKAPKLYTHSGDRKRTSILGGVRVSKNSSRIEAIGSVDELNSFLGFMLSFGQYMSWEKKGRVVQEFFSKTVEAIQQDLFVIGAELSAPMIKNHTVPHPLHRHLPKDPSYKPARIPELAPARVHELEAMIDHFQSQLPPLHNFILPQGNPIGALLQVVRAICRRTERKCVQLAVHSKVNPMILAYLNRLSDAFSCCRAR